MLKDANVGWVILGHSERRHIFGESESTIGEKVKIAVDHGLQVMACVGENSTERAVGLT
jgi:triosephosphate isomerase